MACPFAQQRLSAAAPAESAGNGEEGEPQHQQPQATAPTCPLGFGSARTLSSSAGSCPLGFGGGSNTDKPTPFSFASGLPRMPLEVLTGHKTLVSVKGVVFDVSDVEAYRQQQQLAGWTGHDASRLIALSASTAAADGDSADGADAGLDEGLGGLRYEHHQRLEAYFLELARARRAVAVLTDEDHARIFGAPLFGEDGSYSPATAALAPYTNMGRQGAAPRYSQPVQSALATELHAAVEQGDAEAVAGVLLKLRHHLSDARVCGEVNEDAGNSCWDEAEAERRRVALSSLVACACPRTGMTPLLKAVERGSEAVVKVLLGAGADIRSKAVLYDGDDALALAKRLGCADAIVEMLRHAAVAP